MRPSKRLKLSAAAGSTGGEPKRLAGRPPQLTRSVGHRMLCRRLTLGQQKPCALGAVFDIGI